MSKVGKERALVPERSQRWSQREVSAGSREKSALVPERVVSAGSREKSAREVNPGVSRRRSGCSCRKDTSLEVRPLLVLALLTNKLCFLPRPEY